MFVTHLLICARCLCGSDDNCQDEAHSDELENAERHVEHKWAPGSPSHTATRPREADKWLSGCRGALEQNSGDLLTTVAQADGKNCRTENTDNLTSRSCLR